MRVIYKAPGQPPEERSTPNTLEALQKAVGGYIETVTVAAGACVVCNEEGRLLGLEPNVTFLGVRYVGPILIVGVKGDKFVSLPRRNAGFWLEALSRAEVGK